MSKHTPGPWAKHGGVIRSLGMNDRKVADVRVLDDEGQANANLIAAAPDLLEAIKAARDLWGDYLPPGNSNAMKAMKLVNAAIAKAEGQS